MVQFQQMYFSGIIQRHGRRHARNSKTRVRPTDNISKGHGLDFTWGNVETKDLEREFREAHMRPIMLPVRRQGGNVFWEK